MGRGIAVCGIALGVALGGCADAEAEFTSGRIENRCSGAIPACGMRAGCVLGADQFLRGVFPGGFRVVFRTEGDETPLVTRILLTHERFTGTELQVRVFDTGCAEYDEVVYKDVDLFDLAGDDGLFEQELVVRGRGDHLVEVFSDMGSDFLFRIDPVL
jgi:hypothetical protein